MKVLMIGLGSVGRRHLTVLHDLAKIKVLHYTHEGNTPDFRPKEDYPFPYHVFHHLDKALEEKPDFAIISNPTRFHVPMALAVATRGIPFLLEKPVSDSLDQVDELQNVVDRKKLSTMIGFQLRQHPAYRKLREIVNEGLIGEPISLVGFVGSFLPNWRPSTDYRTCYSSHRALGGGVILDLSHEIDLALSIMGPISGVSCFAGHLSGLEIDCEDVAQITLEHQNGRRLSSLHLNYIERKYEWTTRVTGTRGSVIWDYGNGFVELITENGKTERLNDPDGFDRNRLFSRQMKQWLDVLGEKSQAEVDLRQGIEVTRVALAALGSAQKKTAEKKIPV